MHSDPVEARNPLLQGIGGIATLLLATSTFAQSVDEVVARHRAAIGGKTAIGRVQDRVETWALSVDMFGTTSTGKLLVKSKRPDRLIQKFDVDVSGQQIDWLIGFDGESGWEDNQGAVSPVEGSELVELRHLAWRVNLGELLWHEEAEADLKLLEEAELDGKRVILLELVPKEGKKVTYALDGETYLIRRITGSTIVQGVEAEMDVRLTSYRSVEGVRVADGLSVEITVPEMGVQFAYRLKLEEMKLNTGLEDSDFVGPFGTGVGEDEAATPAGSAEDLLERHFEAIGGVAALERIRDRVGVWSLSMEESGVLQEATITVKTKRPDLIRMGIAVKGEAVVMTMGHDGKSWWGEEPGGRVKHLSDEEVDEELMPFLVFLNGGDLFSLMEAGARFDLDGEEEVNGRHAHRLKVTYVGETPITCHLDAETYQVLQFSSQMKEGGDVTEVQIQPRSHRVVDGVRLSDGLEIVGMHADGEEEPTVRMELLDLKINTGLKRSDFSPPGSENGEEPAGPEKKRGWY